MVKSVKHLNLTGKNLNGCKQMFPDEIRVWHIANKFYVQRVKEVDLKLRCMYRELMKLLNLQKPQP